jgi:glycosyltransferase involved in cell wall biosynthesis
MCAADGALSVWGFGDGHACGYYRVTLPLDALAAHGHQIGTSYGWHNDARGHRVIVGQRVSKIEALPIWRRLRPNHRLVWETDDDLWSVDPSNLAAYWAYGASTLDAAEAAIDAAHMVTVSTQPLADLLRQRHNNVVLLPNRIDGRMLDIERPRRDRVTVGWAGGDSHLRDIGMIAGTLARYCRRNPDVRVHTIGTDFRRALRLPGDFTPWQAQIWDYYRALDFDIGLAPLVASTFNNAKSSIKCVEYASLGIPVIASDEPPYREFVEHGVNGFLVKRDHEWATYLNYLVADEGLRKDMGAAAKERAAEQTIQKHWHAWADAYASL